MSAATNKRDASESGAASKPSVPMRSRRSRTTRPRRHAPALLGAPSRFLVVFGLTALPLSVGQSQMPIVPVLQNGFASSGMTLAVNYGSGGGNSAYSLAASWGPASARFQLSGAVGGVRADTGSTWSGYGFRASVPVWSGMADRLGIALFAGVGGARRDTTSIVRVPVGAGVGYRFAIGETRSVATYASPFFVWSRVSEKGAPAEGDNGMRGSVAADLVLSRNFGLTLGYEFGGGGSVGSAPGSAKGLFGAAVSYAFR